VAAVDHKYVVPALEVKVTLPPLQKVVEPPVEIIGVAGKEFTVTTALPVYEVPVQFTSLTAVSVYVFVLVGDTLIVLGLLVIPVNVIGVVPSVYVILQGWTPVNATDRLVEAPEQIAAVPLITPVGKAFTVKVAALVAVPDGVVTCTVPVVPLPTVTVTVVAVLPVMVAAVPPIATAVAPVKFVPLIVRAEPTQPLDEPKLVIVGTEQEFTVLVIPDEVAVQPPALVTITSTTCPFVNDVVV
jgi:hypothetical protein